MRDTCSSWTSSTARGSPEPAGGGCSASAKISHAAGVLPFFPRSADTTHRSTPAWQDSCGFVLTPFQTAVMQLFFRCKGRQLDGSVD